MVGLVGLICVVVGFGGQPPTLTAGVNEFVNVRAPDEAHNSPSIAVDPTDASTVVVAYRRDAPRFGCAVSVSPNGGATWQPLDLTPALAATDCFWPRVAFLDDGTLLVLYSPLGGPNLLPVSVWLQRYERLQPAGGPLQVAGDLSFWGRMAVAGDDVWVSWVQASGATADFQLGLAPGPNPVVVARSTDGGRTFAPPVTVSEPDRRVIQPSVLAGPDGLVVVGGLDLGDDELNYQGNHDGQTPPDPALRWQVVAWTSTDGGVTFGPTVVVAGDLVVPQLIIADLGPTPGFALDAPRRRLYATYDAGRDDARDVFVVRSDDGGRTWSEPVRVSPTRGEQVLPAVAVGPDGRVDVVFYDRAPDYLQATVVASSRDGGRTFQSTTVSDNASDSRVGLGAQQGVPLQGDHLGALSLPDATLAFWADTSRGTLVTNVQDLAVGRVEVDPGGGTLWALIGVGLACVFAAAMLALVARR
ncbi:MAG: sialidase family protein [Acidimicrobiales bacterium]